MAQPITAVHGKSGILTINSVTAKLTGWTVRVSNGITKYATLSQTADANSQYWMNKIAGLNDAVIEVTGYWDSNATVANKWTGTTYSLRPGMGASGSVVCSFVSGDAFTATVIVQSIQGSTSAESGKPAEFSATLEVDGALAYPT